MTRPSRPDLIRNIGIVAHIDAGKTTLTERVLFYAGRTHRVGDVDDGNTVTDYLPEERQRGITIVSATVACTWRNCNINIVDTPGHVDFTAEVERCLRVLDGAVVVFCGVGGVEPQSETVWRQADKYRVPRICFVNKLDREEADFDEVVRQIDSRLAACPLPVVIPLGSGRNLQGLANLVTRELLLFSQSPSGVVAGTSSIPGEHREEVERRRASLVELAAEHDEILADHYLGDKSIQPEELRAALRRVTLASSAFPVFAGSALKHIGVHPLLDGICDYLPSPRDLGQTAGVHPETKKEEIRKNRIEHPLSALAFKTVSDPHGSITFIRVYSGMLKRGKRVQNSTRNRKEKVPRLVRMFADTATNVDEAPAGDIVAAVGLKFTRTGDTLCDIQHPILLEQVRFPDPVISVAVEPKTAADRERLEETLDKAAKDDPTFAVNTDEETGQIVISGMGELHLQVRLDMLARNYGLHVNVGEPRVSYRETVVGKGRGRGEFHRQIAGKEHFAVVELTVEPSKNDAPGHVVFENAASEAEVPAKFASVVEDNVRDAALSGVLRGDPVIHIKVVLSGGTFVEGQSTEVAYGAAATSALFSTCENAELTMLEPVMSFEIVCPEEFLGGIMKDLRTRRAVIEETGLRGGLRTLAGKVPLSEMFGYTTAIRSLSQGRASCSLEPAEYREVPPGKQNELLNG